MSVEMKSSSVDTVNAIRNSIVGAGNSEYEQRIPLATQKNLADIGNILYKNDNLANAFVANMMNRIAFVLAKDAMYKNPLKFLKRGEIRFGTVIEEVFVEVAKAHNYNPGVAESEFMKRELPDLSAFFHKLNRQNFYKKTIEPDELYGAFLTEDGVTDLIGKITNSLYSGDEYDEYLLMRQLLIQHIERTHTFDVTCPSVTDSASAREVLVKMRSYIKILGFMSEAYNPAGVLTYSNSKNIIIFTTPETQAMIDVEALAMLFHLDKAEVSSRIIVVDTFGDSARGKSTIALITDRDFFLVYDRLYKMTENYNGQGLYWQYYLHHWELMSTSLFSNMIRLTTDSVEDTAITSVTITPSEATVERGGQVNLKADVVGTGNYTNAMHWTIDSDLSTVSSQGVVLINTAEKKTSLTVTATSKQDDTKSGTCVLTIN